MRFLLESFYGHVLRVFSMMEFGGEICRSSRKGRATLRDESAHGGVLWDLQR